jgi:Flp pilus assembly pilin Flp
LIAGRWPVRSRARDRAHKHGQSGQGLIEYSLILMIMAVACLVSLIFFADQLSSMLSLIASAV